MESNAPEIEFPATIIFSGKTKSGKTTALKKLIKKYRSQFDHCYVFTSIKKEEYYDVVHKDHIFGYDKIDILNKFTVDDEKIKEKRRLIILDNFIGDSKLEKNIEKIFAAGRHNNLTIICLSQYIYKVQPTIRYNASYFFILKSSTRDLEGLYEIQDQYNSKEEFITNMKNNMQGFDPIMMCNFVTDNDVTIFKLNDDYFNGKQIRLDSSEDDEIYEQPTQQDEQ